jgi:hypothetical protein
LQNKTKVASLRLKRIEKRLNLLPKATFQPREWRRRYWRWPANEEWERERGTLGSVT